MQFGEKEYEKEYEKVRTSPAIRLIVFDVGGTVNCASYGSFGPVHGFSRPRRILVRDVFTAATGHPRVAGVPGRIDGLPALARTQSRPRRGARL
jgi:hypothetical protein